MLEQHVVLHAALALIGLATVNGDQQSLNTVLCC